MALTIADVEDAQMRARERMRSMRQEFDARYFAPLRETVTASMWRGMDSNVKQQLYTLTPQAAAEMDKRYGGNNGSTI